jgi:hypothetical protein
VNIVWSDDEKEFVRLNAPHLNDERLAAALTRLTGRTITVHMVREQRAQLGIVKKPGRGKCEVKRPPPPAKGLGLNVTGEAPRRD